MITIEQRETWAELMLDCRDAWGHYLTHGGEEAEAWVTSSDRAMSEFLDSITEESKDA